MTTKIIIMIIIIIPIIITQIVVFVLESDLYDSRVLKGISGQRSAVD